jgi:RNA polymerase sigma-70 factor (ECF subfamily)
MTDLRPFVGIAKVLHLKNIANIFSPPRKFLMLAASYFMMEHEIVQQKQRQRACLVARTQEGDRAAFDSLTASLREGLPGIAFVRTGDYAEAEDLVQETLSRASCHVGDLRDSSAFIGWLRAILGRSCATWHRRSYDRSVSIDDALQDLPVDCGAQPPEVLMRREREEELRIALCSIPEQNRTALLMAIWGDCSYRDIAEFSGASLSTIEGRIYRAKSQLRRRLGVKSSDFLGEPSKR